MYAKNLVDRARNDGYKIITVPDNIKQEISGSLDVLGNPMIDLNQFQMDWNKSFKFKFIAEKDMSPEEKKIFKMTKTILSYVGGKSKNVKEIKISETMRLDSQSLIEATGLWEEISGRIIIKRDQLKSLKIYSGTLLHEIAHAKSGFSDVSGEFEQELTSTIGSIVEKITAKYGAK